MKRILSSLVALLFFACAFSQVPADSAALRARVNTDISANGSKQITALKLNQILNSILNLMKPNAIDSGYVSGDTLILVRRGFSNFKLVMPAGTGGSEADPTVPSIVKAITNFNINNWNNKQDALVQGAGIAITGNQIIAKKDSAFWNGNKLQGNAVSTIAPTLGQVLKWNGSQWSPAAESAGSGGGGGYTPPGDNTKILDGTGAAIPPTKSLVGLNLADNTPDSAKPISNPTATALSGKIDSVKAKNDSTLTYYKSGVAKDVSIKGGKVQQLVNSRLFSLIGDTVLDLRVPSVKSTMMYFDPFDYGADTSGVADAWPAYQQALDSAAKYKGTLRPTAGRYRITKTLRVQPPAGQSQVFLNMEGSGQVNNSIIWDGARDSAVFLILGLKNSSITNINVKIPTSKKHVIVWELATDLLRGSLSNNTFKLNFAELGGDSSVFVRMNHIKVDTAGDISANVFENNTINAPVGAERHGQIAFLNEGGNSLQNKINDCYWSDMSIGVTNLSVPGTGASQAQGGGSIYIKGGGGGRNAIDFQFANNSTYTIESGRYELGKRFLDIPGSSGGSSVTLLGVDINDYTPSDGVIFNADRPISLTVIGGRLMTAGTPYTSSTFNLGGYAPGKGFLKIIGSEFRATRGFWNNGAGNWKVSIENAQILNSNGEAIDFVRYDSDSAKNVLTVGGVAPDVNGNIPASGGSPANPTARAGATPINGSATTFMRSDAAPGIDTTFAATKNYADQKRAILPSANYVAFHDSYGLGVTAGSTVFTPYDSIIAKDYGFILNNQSVSGRGVWEMVSRANLDANISNNFKGVITAAPGLNDIRRNGAATPTINKITSSYLSVLLNAFKKSTVNAANSSLTRSGFGLSYTAGSLGGKYGTSSSAVPNTTTGAYSNSVGDSLVYSFTGAYIGVQLMGGDNTYSNKVYIKIDGILTDSIDLSNQWDNVSDGSYNNALGPVAYFKGGLSNASHTITVQNRTTNYCAVDCFFNINQPENTTPVLFGTIPYLNATGYAISPNLGSVAATDIANTAILSVASKFSVYGFPVSTFSTNAFINLATDGFSDSIHLSQAGHYKLANAVKNGIQSVFRPAFANAASATASTSSAISGLTATRIPFAASGTTLSDDAYMTFDATNKRLQLGTASGSYQANIVDNINGDIFFYGKNTSSGNAARTGAAFQNNNGTYMFMGIGGSGYTPYGPGAPDIAQFYGGLGVALMADHNSPIVFATSTSSPPTEVGRITPSGLWGIGQSSPTAWLHLPASTTVSASLRIPAGTAPTSPNAGDMYFDGTHLYYRIGSSWYQLDQQGVSGGMTNPMTTAGDIIYGGSGGTPTRLPIGTAGQTLHIVGGVPTWKDSAVVSNIIVYNFHNTGNTTTQTATYTTPNDGIAHYYSLMPYVDISTAGGGTISTNASYTNERSQSRSLGFYVQGSTSVTYNASDVPYPSASILAAPNTNITFTYSVSGSITYTYQAVISKIF